MGFGDWVVDRPYSDLILFLKSFRGVRMLKKIAIIFSVLFLTSIASHAFDGTQYAQSGEELCLFIRNFFGGLNPYSMQCATGAGAGDFTAHESGFCHKLILEKRMNVGTCLSAISAQNTDFKLDTCEMRASEQEIINCLNQ